MLHMQAIHSWNGEHAIIVVIIHIPELKIIPSFSFILKTWIQIAICLLKQIQVIHELMVCIALTALTTTEEKKNGQSLVLKFRLWGRGVDFILTCIKRNYVTIYYKISHTHANQVNKIMYQNNKIYWKL